MYVRRNPWFVQVFGKLQGSEADIQSALDVREELHTCLQKYSDLKIVDESGHVIQSKHRVDDRVGSHPSKEDKSKVSAKYHQLSSTEWVPNKSFISSEVEGSDPSSLAAQLKAVGKDAKPKASLLLSSRINTKTSADRKSVV